MSLSLLVAHNPEGLATLDSDAWPPADLGPLLRRARNAFELGFDRAGGWPAGVRAGLRAMLASLDRQRAAAAGLTAHQAFACVRALLRGDETVPGGLALFFGPEGRMRYLGPSWDRTRPLTEEVLARGVLTEIFVRIATDDAAELDALLPDLTLYALSPFLSAAEARRIAAA